MNSLDLATAVGSPGFGDGIQGGTAYAGAADSYLTFPASILQGATEVSASFWLKIDDAMDRGWYFSRITTRLITIMIEPKVSGSYVKMLQECKDSN